MPLEWADLDQNIYIKNLKVRMLFYVSIIISINFLFKNYKWTKWKQRWENKWKIRDLNSTNKAEKYLRQKGLFRPAASPK